MTENSAKKRRKAARFPHQTEFSDTNNSIAHSTADLGDALRHARKRQRLSQEELALLTGLRRSYLSEIEGGVTTERLDRLFALFEALGLELVVRPRNVRRGHGPS